VIAQDLSDVVELKRKLEDEKKANQRIVEIAHSNKLEVKRFLGDLSLSKLEAQNKLVAKDSKVADKASYLLRKLHTIKGNSRLLKFSALTAVSHDAEKNIINQIGDSESSKLEFCLKEVLDVVFGEINLYMSVAKDVFGLSFEPVQDDKAGQCASLGEISHSWRQLGRETAIKLEKNVELQVVGDDQLLLPRKKLNILQSVVIQLITNAVDHGIESPDERILAQKDVCGHLWIEMKIEDGKNIYFSLKDDGRGIDKKKLIHRAVQKGVITEQEVVRLNDQQVLGLIFKPGLSTASVVTEYSGRGIGMDVVKNALMELGASWEIESHLGLGTEFRIRLPV
jgi:chemotaxis protein histidine kinase CheA